MTVPSETRRGLAYDVLPAFIKPLAAWDERLIARLPGVMDTEKGVPVPDFARMYVLPAAGTVSARSIAEIETELRRGSVVRAYLVSQKGAGKSMALRHLAQQLPEGRDRHFVVLSPETGVAMDDVAIQDVLLVIAAVIANDVSRAPTEHARLEGETLDLAHRIAKDLTSPTLWPETAPVDSELSAWGRYLARMAREVPDSPTFRDRLRARANVELLVALVNALLRVGSTGDRRPFLFLDDGDKIRGTSASEVFLRNEHVFAKLNADLIATVPFSLKWGGGLAALSVHTPYDIRNVPVVHFGKPTEVLPSAVAWFREVLGRVLDDRIFPDAVLGEAVRLSAGIPTELGRLLRATLFEAGLDTDDPVEYTHLRQAERVQRRPLESATHNATTRESLRAVRHTKRLDREEDYRLVDANMLVQYGNDTEDLWFDVHPLLTEVVDRWQSPPS